MIKWMIASALIFCGLQASANQPTIHALTAKVQQSVMDEAETSGLEWTVGDSNSYTLNGGIIQGTMDMKVREETNEGFWVDQDMDLGFLGKQKVEVLFDKNTGQVLKIIANGEEQDLPEGGNQEVEEMKEDRITVPAGTFDCIYVRVKDLDKNETSEIWVNPSEVPIGGMLKTIAPSQMGPITIEMTGFNKVK